MHRRRFVTTLGSCLGLVSLSGCTGVLPLSNQNDENPEFPGGTLVVENTGDNALDVSVSVAEEHISASFSDTVPPGERVVERAFITASAGEAVTLTAQIDGDGEPTTFEFLPNGGEDNAPPEVAHLAIETPVEESATWTATRGTSE